MSHYKPDDVHLQCNLHFQKQNFPLTYYLLYSYKYYLLFVFSVESINNCILSLILLQFRYSLWFCRKLILKSNQIENHIKHFQN